MGRATLSATQKVVDRGSDRHAIGVSEHDDQRRSESTDREVNALRDRWRCHVSSDPDAEEVTESLIEHDLRRNATVGAADDHSKRLALSAVRRGPAGALRSRAEKSRIAVPEAFKRVEGVHGGESSGAIGQMVDRFGDGLRALRRPFESAHRVSP
jgi:hypothetical protein